MPSLYGNQVAKTVRTGIARVGPGAWSQLTSALVTGVGTHAILSGRQWIQLQVRGHLRAALAITYTCRSLHGDTFETTVPAYTAQGAMILQPFAIFEVPIGVDVMMWGRMKLIGGSGTVGGVKIIVTEFA